MEVTPSSSCENDNPFLIEGTYVRDTAEESKLTY